MKLLAPLLLAFSMARAATPPPDVLDFFRTFVENFADNNEQGVLDHFDPAMPGFAALRDDVKTMLAARDVTISIEFVSDEGDADQRMLQIDMVLTTDDKLGAGDSTSKRVVVKTHIERKAEPQNSSRRRTKPATPEWKITALEPLDVFKIL